MILNANGEPYVLDMQHNGHGLRPEVSMELSYVKAFANYLSALYQVDLPAMRRAENPFLNHAWVYAGAMAIAINISQAPFTVWRETKEQEDIRKADTIRKGYAWSGAQAGVRRKAIQRYLEQPMRRRGVRIKGVEADPDHPMMDVFTHPNEAMSGTMLWQATAIWQVLEGSCIWAMFGENGADLAPNQLPVEIWPLPPRLFEPLYDNDGRHNGWDFQAPGGMGQGRTGRKVRLLKHQAIQFRFFNPDYNHMLYDGFAPVAASANAIGLDLLANEQNRATIINGADPGGILMSDGEFESKADEEAARKKFEQRHQGARNRRRVAVLSGGLKYISTGLSNAEMEYSLMKDKNRDEILAAMGVPKSIVFVTDALNYATAITQKKLFWENRLIPMIRAWENEVDRVLMDSFQDNVSAGFDLSQIEALRDGLNGTIGNAMMLSGDVLHVPPKLAFETAGLEIEDYPGIDVALVAGQKIDNILNPPPPPDNPLAGLLGGGASPPPEKPGTPARTPVGGGADKPPALLNSFTKAVSRPVRGLWHRIIRTVHEPVETRFAAAWRSFIMATRKLDAPMLNVRFTRDFVLTKDLNESRTILRAAIRPVYAQALEQVYDFTLKEVGTALVMPIDDPEIMDAMDSRESALLSSAPASLESAVNSTVRKGVEAGETQDEIAARVARVYHIASSSAKALTIARTTTAGFISEVRNALFLAQGIDRLWWITADDENVRSTHEVYGRAAPKPMGFNYMSLSGREDEGSLTYPCDPDAPADEVINCRCIQSGYVR